MKWIVEEKVDLTRQRYDDQAKLENLPTSIPNEEFVQAALREAEDIRAEGKRRRRKAGMDPNTGFSISDAAVKLLTMKGIPDRRRGPRAISSSSTTTSDAITGFNTVTSTGEGHSGSYIANQEANANSVSSRRVRLTLLNVLSALTDMARIRKR